MAQVCRTCKGSGILHGTAPLYIEGGQQSSNPNKDYTSSTPTSDINYGLFVPCWKCLGKGTTPDERQDAGEQTG